MKPFHNRLLVIILGALLVGVLIALIGGRSKFLPPCLFHELTGFHCIGCGATRATHALLHGDIIAAARFNLLYLIVAPMLGLTIAAKLLNWLFQRPIIRLPHIPHLAKIALWSLLAFWILRNLPGFEFLAPQSSFIAS